jgi:hypothetical protein
MDYCFISYSLNTGNDIGVKGAIKLADTLKSNSTLTELFLRSNRLASSYSYSIQVMLLVMKE